MSSQEESKDESLVINLNYKPIKSSSIDSNIGNLDGYYITNGKAIKIVSSKHSEDEINKKIEEEVNKKMISMKRRRRAPKKVLEATQIIDLNEVNNKLQNSVSNDTVKNDVVSAKKSLDATQIIDLKKVNDKVVKEQKSSKKTLDATQIIDINEVNKKINNQVKKNKKTLDATQIIDIKELNKRLNSKEKEQEQKAVLIYSAIMFISGFIIAGLNYRYKWIVLPNYVVIISAILFIIAYILYAEVLRENAYLLRTIEVTKDQKLVDTGMYAIVRHPMYAVTLLLFLTIPLILNSLISFIIFLIYPFIIIKRLKNEELVLEKDLKGYKEYENKVKYRLIPFIW